MESPVRRLNETWTNNWTLAFPHFPFSKTSAARKTFSLTVFSSISIRLTSYWCECVHDVIKVQSRAQKHEVLQPCKLLHKCCVIIITFDFSWVLLEYIFAHTKKGDVSMMRDNIHDRSQKTYMICQCSLVWKVDKIWLNISTMPYR